MIILAEIGDQVMKTIHVLKIGLAFSMISFGAQAAQLRLNAVTPSDVVRLGDIFEGIVSGDAERPVAPAPAYGQPVTYDADFLRRLAETYHVNWQPSSQATRITVSRSARIIGITELRPPLAAALARRSSGGRLEIEFDNPEIQLAVPTGLMPAITISDVFFNPRVGRFTAEAVVGAGGPAPQRLALTGQAHVIIEMPVLNRRVNAGEVILPSDIGWVEVDAKEIYGNIATSEADLVNHTPRRSLAANMPVYLHEVQAQRLVARGQMVTMVLRTNNMLLTTEGRATRDGGAGEVIKVINTQSNRAIDATVISANEVSVFAPGFARN